jgi:hypothetical protein
MHLVREDEGKKLLPSDSPWLGSHALIFKPRAVDALGPLLREHGELLPLLCDNENLTMFNPTSVLDALDEGASSLARFSDGQIMRINRYVFRPALVRDAEIFKISSLRVSPTFVSHRFVDAWQKKGLRGLDFKQVWKS